MHQSDKTKEKKNNEKQPAASPEVKADSPKADAAKVASDADSKKMEKDETTLLKEKIADLEKQLSESNDNRLRLLAEMDNQRKRALKDQENVRLSSVGDTVAPFLQVFDHFSMAVKASEKSDNLKTLLDGMKMIGNEFDKAFGELGIERIDAEGKDFDPNLHEAVSQEPSDTVPAGKVLRQWSCGYKSPQRLYKPAMVVVSSGPK